MLVFLFLLGGDLINDLILSPLAIDTDPVTCSKGRRY